VEEAEGQIEDARLAKADRRRYLGDNHDDRS
jgi:hypothetical protein